MVDTEPNTLIETSRLRLRRWKRSDLEPFVAMNADPEVMRYYPHPFSSEETLRLSKLIDQEFEDYGYGFYATEEKATGSFMGFIGFHHATIDVDFCPCIEIGWRLDKRFWNKGYATEGAIACLEEGFTHLGFRKVYSYTAQINIPSQRVMQKSGMHRGEAFLHPNIEDGNPLKPHVYYWIEK